METSEQVFSIRNVIKHPIFHPSRPINYDIAVLTLDGNIAFDKNIFPVCLPNLDDVFEPGFLCVALGWGRLFEKGLLPRYLQEVYLPIIPTNDCTEVMATLKGGRVYDTIICAGFPEGGKDACQGDSGGPLLCQRTHGSWVLAGVTSWGMGCGRKWANNRFQAPDSRGSPGIFTDIKTLIRWVNAQLDSETLSLAVPKAPCSVKDGLISATTGEIRIPGENKKHYENNELCTWTIKVPNGKQILLNFRNFNIEPDAACDLDYLALYSADGQLIGKYCGEVPPLPILITSATVMVKFISDFQIYRAGFLLTFSTVEKDSYDGSGCGSLAIHLEEGEIQSMNYPKNYDNQANCHWVIHAPKYHHVKLTFEDFQVEYSQSCKYDSVLVYQGLVGEDVLAKLCGFSRPPPIQSSNNILQIKFISDKSENYRGFRATISFVKSQDFVQISSFPKEKYQQQTTEEKMEKTCGASPTPPRFISRSLAQEEEAIPYSWPWHVSLQFGSTHMCDGALISEDWVLTSASCMFDRSEFRDLWLVVAGIHDLTGSEYVQKRSVKLVVIQSEFESTTFDYDLAMVLLADPFQFTKYIRPLCLPGQTHAPMPSSLCIVTGWGFYGKGGKKKSTKLQQLEVPILAEDVCKELYETHDNDITPRMFCAGFPEGKGNYICPGQTGSPLVCLSEETQTYSMFGVVSFGASCKEDVTPAVFTNVSALVGWIQQMIDVQGNAVASSLADQLTGDKVPCTIWSVGSAVTVEVSTTFSDPTLGFWLLYSFHDHS
ncbi:ovochymase-2-like [Discoglossus pictus]